MSLCRSALLPLLGMHMRPPPPPMMGPPLHMRGMGFRGRGGPPPRGRFPPGPGMQRGRIMKRKRMTKEIDLNKQWVTEAIKIEFKKKEELLAAARGTTNKDSWTKYRAQREKCNQMYQSAEMEFIGQPEVRITQLLPTTNFAPNTAPIDYTADVFL